MNVQTDHLENHTARLTVEIDPDRIEKAMRQAARRISKKSRIPGFRPGKAPYDIIINMFGREYVLSEALDTLGNEVYREALKASGIEPYAPGSLEDVAEDGQKLVFVVPKRPEVTLGDYRAMRVEHDPIEVTDKMVDEAMEDIRQRQAVVEPVEREARLGDQVTFSHLEIVVLDDEDAPDNEDTAADEEIADATGGPADDTSEEAADENNADSDVDSESEADSGERLLHKHDFDRVLTDDPEKDLFPGFSAPIVGMSAGDEKEFTITIPDDDEDEEIAGETLHIEAHVARVQSRTVPEWTDDLARRVSEDRFETILELRMDVRRQLEEQAEAIARQEITEQALDQLVEEAEFHYPEELVQEYISELLDDIDHNVLRRQGLTLQDFLQITGQTEDDLRNQYRENAIRRAERALAFGEFIRQEKLAVSEDEINAEIDRLSTQFDEQFGEQADQFKMLLSSPQSRLTIHNDLMSSQAIDRLVAIARGETIETIEEPADDEADDDDTATTANETPEPDNASIAVEAETPATRAVEDES